MKKALSLLIVLGPLCVFASACAKQARSEEAGQTPEKIWSSSCGYCHGGPMNAPVLHGRQLPEDVVIFFVRRGANGMPPFHESAISDAELQALARWIRESPAPETGKAP